jgi:hypothetical protein
MKSPQARRPSPETLGLALRQRIRDDYWHARGANSYGDFMQATTRWHPDAYIPATIPDFNAAWRPWTLGNGFDEMSFGEYWRARMAAILVCGQAKVAGSNPQPFDDGLEATEASTEHHSDRGA